MRRSLFLVILLLLPPSIAAVSEKTLRYPRRFATVEEGRVYRGGYPSASQLRHIAEDKRVQTLISLTDPQETPEERDMLATADEMHLIHWRFAMPGDGRGDFAALDAAADAIADASHGPIYFHCAAGKQRSNAAQAAYRMKHCGYSLEKALDELEQNHDLDRQSEKALVDHLTAYAKHLASPQPSQPQRNVTKLQPPAPPKPLPPPQRKQQPMI